jgi:hypothetical protein
MRLMHRGFKKFIEYLEKKEGLSSEKTVKLLAENFL